MPKYGQKAALAVVFIACIAIKFIANISNNPTVTKVGHPKLALLYIEC
jgi:hypothetical protein